MNRRNTKDVIWLTLVRIITILFGIVGTRLLSGSFSYDEYSTYSQLIILVDLMTSISILGMTDGVNFYYSKARDDGNFDYVNSIFTLQLMVGLFDALILVVLSGTWASILNNNLLKRYIIWIALRPMLNNFIAMLSVLNVAIGNSRLIACRNAFFSFVKLIGIIITVRYENNMTIILFCFLFFDFISTLLFIKMYNRAGKKIKFKFSAIIWKDIILFCAPIGAYVLVNGLFRSVDKLIISVLGTSYQVSIYMNGSAQLPFDIFWTSVQTIVIPIITFYITRKSYINAFGLFCSCMRINAILTIPIVACAFIIAPDLICLLYGKKYLKSINIFRIYILTEAIKYLGTSIVLTSSGNARYLLKLSSIMLCINGILDLLLFNAFGLIGPAIATVLVTFVMVLMILNKSLSVMESTILKFIKNMNLLVYLISVFLLSIIAHILRKNLLYFKVHGIINILFVAGTFVILFLVFNRKTIKHCFKKFDEYKTNIE